MNPKTVTLALALLGAVASAPAVQLVQNGGFESTPEGWAWALTSTGGNTLAEDISAWDGMVDGLPIPTNSIFLGGYAEGENLAMADDVLTQSVVTTGYASATLSFDLVSNGFDLSGAPDPTDYLVVSFGGRVLDTIDLGNDTNPFSAHRTYDVSADLGGTDVLKFLVHNDQYYDASAFIDNVSITASPAPEPATMAALGLGAAAMLRRRRH